MKTIDKILGIATYISLFVPVAMFEKHHNCDYDVCLIIHTSGGAGACIERTIDTVCGGLIVVWFIVINIGAIVLNKCNNAISPFVVAALIIIIAIVLACMDPSKWKFALSLIPSFVLLIICTCIDCKRNVALSVDKRKFKSQQSS